MLQTLTTPETLTVPAHAHRFMVELASTETELDAYGVAVPAATKILDVVVTSPKLEEIVTLLEAAGHLEGYQVVGHWVPEDCCCF